MSASEAEAEDDGWAPGLVERFDIEPYSDFQPNDQTLEGSFSSVSTPIFACKYSFCSMNFFFREKKSACTFFSPDRRDCRSRKMRKNECLVAKIGLDTEENEPSKVC